MHWTPKSIHAARELSRAMSDLPATERFVLWRIPSSTVIALHDLYLKDTYGELRDLRSIIGWFDLKPSLRAYAAHHATIKAIVANIKYSEKANDLIRSLKGAGFHPKLAVGKTSHRYAAVLDLLAGIKHTRDYCSTLIGALESVNALRMAYNEPELVERIIDVANEHINGYGGMNIDAALFVDSVRTSPALMDGLL